MTIFAKRGGCFLVSISSVISELPCSRCIQQYVDDKYTWP